MNTKHTKFLLPLAALALVSAACNPFPAKPGGDPAVVRVVTYGGSGGASNTVETVTGGNTVSTDFAQPDEMIRVQFNKPMDGSTIQRFTNYETAPIDPDTVGIRSHPADPGDPAATPPVDPIPAYTDDGLPYAPCTVPSNLTLTGFEEVPGVPGVWDMATHDFVPGTGTYPVKTKVCYDPASATDGGQITVTPAVPLKYGVNYTITGTVKDYQGKALTINVSVTVDKRPIPYGVDGYTTGVYWFDSGVATTYDVEVSSTGTGGWTPLYTGLLPGDVCAGGVCDVVDVEKVPYTDYFYRVTEDTTLRPDAQGPGSTFGPLNATLGVASTTSVPPVIFKGIIRVGWGSVTNADGYNVETSLDGTAWTLYSHHTTSPRVVYLGTPAPGTTDPTADGSLTSGTVYYVRVTPTFADLFVAEPGNVKSKVAP